MRDGRAGPVPNSTRIVHLEGDSGRRRGERTELGGARRALVLHDHRVMVDLIELTLNHGLFVVRSAENLAEAEAILAAWRPHLTVADMDHEDSGALLRRLAASHTLKPSATPVLGLTRRGDLQTKLRAFDLGVDDILTVPFSPEELLARAIVIARRASGTELPIVPTITLGEIEIDILNREVRRNVRGAPVGDRTEPSVPAGQPRRARGES